MEGERGKSSQRQPLLRFLDCEIWSENYSLIQGEAHQDSTRLLAGSGRQSGTEAQGFQSFTFSTAQFILKVHCFHLALGLQYTLRRVKFGFGRLS